MPSFPTAPRPNLRKMTTRSLAGTMIALHLLALPFLYIAICQIRLAPRHGLSYGALIPFFLFLGIAYTDYLGELLRRRRTGKDASRNTVQDIR